MTIQLVQFDVANTHLGIKKPTPPLASHGMSKIFCKDSGAPAKCMWNDNMLMMLNESLTADAPTTRTINFEAAVEGHYKSLYKFAFGLAGNASDAADLTQETYRVLLAKAGQIRDARKIKSWLFTTLHRQFLARRRHLVNFPELELEQAELPAISAPQIADADAGMVMAALRALDEKYRAPLAMFYLEDMSYREIADVLGVPPGTVMSRLSRGKEQLKQQLAMDCCPAPMGESGRPRCTRKVPVMWTTSKWKTPLTAVVS